MKELMPILLSSSVALAALLALPGSASAQGERWCADCDPEGSGCTVVQGPGHYKCTNLGEGACRLEDPGCGSQTLLDLHIDGSKRLTPTDVAGRGWEFQSQPFTDPVSDEMLPGQRVLRTCGERIAERRYTAAAVEAVRRVTSVIVI